MWCVCVCVCIYRLVYRVLQSQLTVEATCWTAIVRWLTWHETFGWQNGKWKDSSHSTSVSLHRCSILIRLSPITYKRFKWHRKVNVWSWNTNQSDRDKLPMNRIIRDCLLLSEKKRVKVFFLEGFIRFSEVWWDRQVANSVWVRKTN